MSPASAPLELVPALPGTHTPPVRIGLYVRDEPGGMVSYIARDDAGRPMFSILADPGELADPDVERIVDALWARFAVLRGDYASRGRRVGRATGRSP